MLQQQQQQQQQSNVLHIFKENHEKKFLFLFRLLFIEGVYDLTMWMMMHLLQHQHPLQEHAFKEFE